ncbi:hypothetical protein CKO31_07375 [Thiohalocapsa halophila]|uniref:Sulfatase-modifying factor enzyme-like domain-containing protein n=1 Tax=Thiohalocapsa halophila TaxID=69359 RepID=A0ABS1CFS3_9GAMM|nr:SUMF1/EgtB/PvdO family nonheme iron enzyme [Thiohalocapsa halophila]MBK1630568.1 hypothetical protein [Thiohalocapsa halophila]
MRAAERRAGARGVCPDDEGIIDAKTGAGPHRLDYGWWIARWPLTVAQWRAYLDGAGREAEDARSLRGPANTPVVYVFWREAMRCADRLTQHWQRRGLLPAGWRVTLRSEPEWQQAAQGGERIPAPGATLMRTLTELAAEIGRDPPLAANPEPRRRYPWGDEADSERMKPASAARGPRRAAGAAVTPCRRRSAGTIYTVRVISSCLS